MRIKKFNELFDTEELKSNFEIKYLQGKTEDILADMSKVINTEDETIYYLMQKLIKFKFPFFSAFFDHIKDGIEFETFELGITQMDGEWIFTVKSDNTNVVSLGIIINAKNDYNVFIAYGDVDDLKGYEYKSLDIEDFSKVIDEVYIPTLMDYNYSEFVDYNSEYKKYIDN
jgi:hypothetical protein